MPWYFSPFPDKYQAEFENIYLVRLSTRYLSLSPVVSCHT